MSATRLLRALGLAITVPTQKQREAYGRFAHTLAAAAVIGAITIVFTEGATTRDVAWRVFGLIVAAVVCFAAGILFLEDGEWK